MSRRRPLAVAAAAGMLTGLCAFVAVFPQAADAGTAVTCPEVAPGTGAVTPAPSPGVDWSDCNLSTANLSGADLTEANLIGADLTGADLTGTNLSNARLITANLKGADVAGANLDAPMAGVSSGGVTGVPAALPPHWLTADGYLIGPAANLTGADLAGMNLTGDDLSAATLTGTNLSGTSLSGANLVNAASGAISGTPASLPGNWVLLGGYLLGPNAQLDGADLSGRDLSGLDLTDANLSLSSLDGAQLTDTDLTGASLSYASLNGSDLAGADLTGANLGEANLTSASLAGSTATGTDFASSLLTSASLAGSAATGADFYGAVLNGTDLTAANLTDANFNAATLANDSLAGLTLTGATFVTTVWLNTTCPDGSNSNAYVDGCYSPLDTTPPAADPFVAHGELGSHGWYTSPVMVWWGWTDNGTIVVSQCTTSSTTTGNGKAVTVTASCTDLAGNVGHASFVLKIDQTRPAVTVTGVRNHHTYRKGHVPIAGCRTTDTISGVATHAKLTITRKGKHGLGRFTVTCTGAVSIAGTPQARPQPVTYTVIR
jgi:uncharacterized protein YjbI with pentapeptide repeats